ncbi:hypothetical protein HOL24_00395 [bacterium]|jgi:acyl carrier protein|nr:hypothetical protein [bacterium]
MKVKSDDIIDIIKNAGTQADALLLNEYAILRDIGCDSLDMMNVFLHIQEKYDVEIDDDDIDKLNTVHDFLNFINKK